MPKILRDTHLPKLKYGNGPSKVYDGYGDGLFVHLTKTKSGTSRHFKYDYVIGGKRKQISYGKYPDIGLSHARELHRMARALIAEGKDPVHVRRRERQATEEKQRTLNTVFDEFFVTREWRPSHAKKEQLRWNKHVSTSIGKIPLDSIDKADIRNRIGEIQSESVDTANRVLSLIDQVFSFAESFDYIDRNPANSIKGALSQKKHEQKNHPAIKDPEKLGQLMNRVDQLENKMARAALRIIAITFVRHSGIRLSEWSEIDFNHRLWTIPAERMKAPKNGDLRIPLPPQAVTAFESLRAITGGHKYVLTTGIPKGGKVAPISDGTLNKSLALCVPREEHVVHSFRQTAYTLLREKGYEKALIKTQMHHAKEKVEAAYNKDDQFQQRKEMLEWWASYLDLCREKARG